MSDSIFVCGMTTQAFAAAAGGINRWPEQPITWASEGGVGRVSALDFRGIIPFGLTDIEAVCAARFKYQANAKTAHLLFRAAQPGEGGMGQPGQVLADAMLVIPGLKRNADFQSTLRFDPGEVWTSVDDMLNGKIPMRLVIKHEAFHAVGGGHAPDPADIMYPTITRGVTEFGQWSRGQLVARYGENGGEPQPGSAAWEFKVSKTGNVQIFRDGVRQRVSPSPFAA